MIAAIHAAALDAAEADFWESLAPAGDPRGLTDFARSLRLAEGVHKGMPYDPRSHPAQLEILAAQENPHWTNYTVMGPTQDGKTFATIIIPLVHALVELHLPVVLGQPDMQMLSDTWMEKIRPLIEESGLGAYLPDKGFGSEGGTKLPVVRMKGAGTLFLMGAGGKNQAAQASRTVARLYVDEADSIKSGLLELMDRRVDNYGAAARRIRTSTIKFDHASPIVLDYESSTAARLFFQCAHCDHWQTYDWERVSYDDADEETARETASMGCEHCGVALREADRQAAIAAGHRLVMRGQHIDHDSGLILGDPPRTRRWGLRWTALDSPLRDLRTLCALHYTAKKKAEAGDIEPLRNFHRDQLTECFVDPDEELMAVTSISRTGLASRSMHGPHEMGTVPPEAEALCLTVDVQQSHCYWLLTAFDREGRSWDVAWDIEHACEYKTAATQAQYEAMFSTVDRYAEQYSADSGKRLVFKGADVAYSQGKLVPWLLKHGWQPIKGMGADEARGLRGKLVAKGYQDRPGTYYIRKQMPGHWKLLRVETVNIREAVHHAYLMPIGEPGAAMLPRGVNLNSTYIKHLCSWALQKDKHGIPRWERTSGVREDYLDARIYAMAGQRLAVDLGKLDEKPAAEKQAQAAPSAPRGGWAGGGNVW